ncbi:GNAT family N-acetyltransferase [Streptomycetaceae bacterium NBC_01309]
MTAPRLHLREFAPADTALLTAWLRTDRELTTWAGTAFTWPLDPPQLLDYASESDGTSRHTWTAVAGRPVGHASLRLDTGSSCDAPGPPGGRLGRVLVDPAARGTGLGVELVGAAGD